jgi:methionine-rich copper-binding protein CopC
MNRRRFVVIFSSTLAVLAGSPARAHAVVVHSAPAANETISGPDIDILIRFNSRIDIARSRLRLADSAKRYRTLEIGDLREPNEIRARTAGLANGSHWLSWQVLAVDGHITRGEIPFTVARP